MRSKGQIAAAGFSEDILEFIRLLGRHEVRYVIVGGEAVIFYGYPRLTGDIDFLYDRTEPNSLRLFNCLVEFWRGEIPEIANAAFTGAPGYHSGRIPRPGKSFGAYF